MMDPRKLPVLKNYEFINANGIPCNLGFGAYGSVQLGKCLVTGQTVAIKKIGRKIAKAEVDIHLKLNHPNIIRMLDHYFDEKHECTYIILEYAENGTLFDYIREHGLKDKRMIRGIFMSVCDAIDYMHSKNIMHRDIKVTWVLFSRKIFCSIERMLSRFAISVLLSIANLEWPCAALSNTWHLKWFSGNPIAIKSIYGVWESYCSKWSKVEHLSKATLKRKS